MKLFKKKEEELRCEICGTTRGTRTRWFGGITYCHECFINGLKGGVEYNIDKKQMEKYICHDCNKQLEENEEYMPYKVGNEGYLKCKDCHQKDPVLRNFQETECYSRIVGYIRPVKQWNPGKKSEKNDRKEYKV